MLDTEDDIASDIQAAFDSAAADTPVDTVIAEAPSAETPPPEASDGPARGPDGKFVAKETAGDAAPPPAAQTPEAAAPAAETPQDGEVQPDDFSIPPRSLKAEAKAAFKDWPALARQEIIRRDVEMTREAQRLRGEVDRWQPVEAVLAPHRQQFQMLGLNDAQVIQKLVAAHQYLEREPTAAIQQLARQYGAQLQPPEPGQATPQGDPTVQRLQQQLSTLEQRLHAQNQSATQRQQAQIVSEIQSFADARDERGQPKHLYFDDVKEEMAALMDAGRADTLETAYDMAIWGRPDIRKLVLAQERAAQEQDQRQRQAQHAQQAKAAGVSITGAVPTGAKPPSASDPNASIEDDIRAAIHVVSGRV